MTAEPHVYLFLSTVTAEFRSYRDALLALLSRPNVTVRTQEHFIPTGTLLLDKLDDYIRQCDAVIHLTGDMTGAEADSATMAALRRCCPDIADDLPPIRPSIETGSPVLSYAQIEAYLALYHDRRLVIAVPEPGALRYERFAIEPAQQQAQQAHLARLRMLGRFPEITFGNADQLAAGLFRSSILDLLVRAEIASAAPMPGNAPVIVPKPKPINLPYPSLGALFKGREDVVVDLRASLEKSPSGNSAIVGKAVHGLGGVGKTRLAVEYAWRDEAKYTALLFAVAEARVEATTVASGISESMLPTVELRRNLAALAGPLIRDLAEKDIPDEETRVVAVLRWLQANPGWLLIIDNADSDETAKEVEKLPPHLRGGQQGRRRAGGAIAISPPRSHRFAAASPSETASPRPTPATPAGSAISRSPLTRSATCWWRKAISPPRSHRFATASPSETASPRPISATPAGSAISRFPTTNLATRLQRKEVCQRR